MGDLNLPDLGEPPAIHRQREASPAEAAALAALLLKYGPPTKDGSPMNYGAHAGVGGLLGNYIANQTGSSMMGIGAATALGIGKELTDKNFDKKDAAATALGGLLGTQVGGGKLMLGPQGVFWTKSW